MKNNKHAISLIVLVVTILVLAILAAAVIISLSNANIMGEASKATFKQDMANYKEAYELYVTNKLAANANFDRSTLKVTNADNPTEFKEIFGDKVPDKYKNGLKVVNGKLIYETTDETEKAVLEELVIASSVAGTTPSTPTNAISKDKTGDTSPYLGWYAWIGDETNGEYGIIFADMLYGGEGTWSTTNTSTYSYSAVTDTSTLKDYVVSDESYEGSFGTHPVLEVTGSTENKVDRFYVMALSDVTQSTDTTRSANYFTWHDAAYNSGINNANSQVTSNDFGSGKTNTARMIIAWNKGIEEGGYGAQNTNSGYSDMWGVIQTKVNNGWFVPSKDEWSAFAVYLQGREPALTTSNYSTEYGLSDNYWSSSLYSSTGTTYSAWNADFADVNMNYKAFRNSYCVRLAATF